ncbi:pirin family protein [uncultured Desulfuromusa sp.]|uniref:pirin family protein n=1 Tax=uncultured Desulfuromusa sp. TaxID=219183 RepID=UPI002AA6B9CF|nr:pirin family protein [uncultured Desulfuromusa sp.]
MSDLIAKAASCQQSSQQCSAIRLLLEAVEQDLGGFSVRRFLPSNKLAHIGPFIFFDHLGPAIFPPGKGIDVRPHPHIGLATVTYVFSGEILHRDSLGHVQAIRPDEINWMTAGKGISHSERTPPQLRQQEHVLEALQLWVALPEEEQECEPFFTHYDESALPVVAAKGRKIRVMVGEAYGVKSAVKVHSQTLYIEVDLAAGETLNVPDHVAERAVYVISGRLLMQQTVISVHSMAVLTDAKNIELKALDNTRLVIIGGKPLGKRTVWWNLVSSRKDLIEQAKQDWRNRSFPQVPDEDEYIPVPNKSIDAQEEQ